MIKTQGMSHVALRVADVARSRNFYTETFGMRVVWQPDEDNAYLSTGPDNLALHHEAGAGPVKRGGALDHIGFFVAELKELEESFAWARQRGIPIVKPLRQHRDRTWSFYLQDPDGIVIQLIHDPSRKG